MKYKTVITLSIAEAQEELTRQKKELSINQELPITTEYVIELPTTRRKAGDPLPLHLRLYKDQKLELAKFLIEVVIALESGKLKYEVINNGCSVPVTIERAKLFVDNYLASQP
jgi:hypothetical protein